LESDNISPFELAEVIHTIFMKEELFEKFHCLIL